MDRRLIARMVAAAGHIKDRLLSDPASDLEACTQSLSTDCAREIPREEAADTLAQAIACAAPIIAAAGRLESAAAGWLARQLSPWELAALAAGKALSTQYAVQSTETAIPNPKSQIPNPSAAHLFEPFLHAYNKDHRKRHGVFFTPQPIADYIVHAADSLVRTKFGLSAGLGDELAQIIDPACGTGVFLLAAIDLLYRQTAIPIVTTAHGSSAPAATWTHCVDALLPRLVGLEILPASAFLAKLNIALKLAETGYDFQEALRINIHVADALAPLTQSQIPNPKSQIPVLLGNPPFSSLSTTTNDWIARLVRGDDLVRGYARADGHVLGERKTWLHDDYVKFFRLAQWHVEEAGGGVVGFVTNHGYLDNATFRLMRHELLRVFPRIQILDLHGNRKKHEVAPDGSRDENVFGLDQGVAIGLFCRPTPSRSVSEGDQPRVEHADLWGSRTGKLATLATLAAVSNNVSTPRGGAPSLTLPLSVISPQPPDWRLVPARAGTLPHAEYDRGWSLADAMPLNATAPVTARDHFVVAFTAEELVQRIATFCDLSIPDEEIRRRYFQRTRSARYATGDTRGWKLADARRAVAADANWQRHITRCLYRPFDWRYVFWHPAMIDWPRTDVTRDLTGTEGRRDGETERERDGERENEFSVPLSLCPSVSPSLCLSVSPSLRLCLIARRQQLPTQPCTFFWVTDGLALDGVIRSDNRGSESLFPVYVRAAASTGQESWQANFAPQFIAEFKAAVGLCWRPLGSGDLDQTFGPDDVAAYIYALFHAPQYRERYAEQLRRDFPRVLVPRSAALFATLCRCGRLLVEQHLLRGAAAPPPDVADGAAASTNNSVLSTQYSVLGCSPAPHPTSGPPCDLAGLPAPIANFRVGGYVALRKWLQPKHRSPEEPIYREIAAAIARTIDIMAIIDRAIAERGGLENAFQA